MDKQKFLQLEVKDISQVYMGKQNCCRCGCGGDYTATSYMVEPRSEVDDKVVARHLKRAKKLVEQGAEVDFGGTYIDVTTGKDRTLTFYIDEVKGNN